MAVDLGEAFASFDAHWSPRTVATVNDYDVRIGKGEGEFPRHSHPDTDELFLVVAGELTLRLDDGDVVLRPGQLHVVPRGAPHQPAAAPGTQFVMLEPSATLNTGDTPGAMTAPRRLL